MSLSDIEFVSPHCLTIKTEDIKDDFSAVEECKSSENTNISYLIASSTKCGEIFTTNNTEFILVCESCRESYDTLNEFGEHLRQKHTLNEEEKEDIREYHETVELILDDNTSVHSFEDADNCPLGSESEEDQLDSTEELTKEYLCNEYTSGEDSKKHIRIRNEEREFISDGIPRSKPCDEKETERAELYCKLCDKKYRTRDSFSKHKCQPKRDCKSKPNAQKIAEESPDDPETPKEQSELKNSKITNPDLYCEICDRQYKYKNIFKKHGMQHTIPPIALKKDPEYLKCRFCGIIAPSHNEWYRHENSHNDVTPYQCTYCPKRFKSRIEVDMHTNSHTGNRPFKCDQCGASFAHNNNLATHIKRVHLRLTPFSCDVCDKKFLRNVELRIHMRQHTGERPYQCEECGRSFMIAVQLNEHRKKHTNVRDVKCPDCPMAFFTKKMLRKHMVKHSDERPHVCSICGRTFSRKKALVVHSKIHQDFKEYVCAICGKAFAQPAGLYSHKKSHINTVDST